MKEIRTEIIINAPQEKVWQILTDFAAYPEWNPFIIEIIGEAAVEAKLKTTMRSGDKDRVFKPQIVEWVSGERFAWLGKLPLGMFSGRHHFVLENAGNGQTKLIHGEHFGGLLRGMILNKIGEETEKSFVAMNRALKQRAEQ